MGKSILSDRVSMGKMLMVITFLFVASCQKLDTWLQDNGFDDKGSSQALHLKADVAHDWFNLQIGIILYNPPATPNTGRAFAYSGIILYETVRSGIPKSHMQPLPWRETGVRTPAPHRRAPLGLVPNDRCGQRPWDQKSEQTGRRGQGGQPPHMPRACTLCTAFRIRVPRACTACDCSRSPLARLARR